MIHMWDEMGVGAHFLDVEVDTKSYSGRLTLRLMVAVAEWEAQRIRERNRETAALRISRGMPIGKPPARIGFRYEGLPGQKELVPDRHDRDVIEQIVQWRIAGGTFDAITMHLQRQNRKTSAGREWSFQRVKRAYYAEVEWLLKNGYLEKSGRGHRGQWKLRWIKAPPGQEETLERLYKELGRKINDHLDPPDTVESAATPGGSTVGA